MIDGVDGVKTEDLDRPFPLGQRKEKPGVDDAGIIAHNNGASRQLLWKISDCSDTKLPVFSPPSKLLCLVTHRYWVAGDAVIGEVVIERFNRDITGGSQHE